MQNNMDAERIKVLDARISVLWKDYHRELTDHGRFVIQNRINKYTAELQRIKSESEQTISTV